MKSLPIEMETTRLPILPTTGPVHVNSPTSKTGWLHWVVLCVIAVLLFGWTLINPSWINSMQETIQQIYPFSDDFQSTPQDPTIHPLDRHVTSNKQPTPQPQEEPSVTVAGNSGYCYVGTEKGFRSCATVRPNDVCMSGTIYPTREICIDPSLRL